MTNEELSALSGLSEKELKLLRTALANQAGLTRAFIFGSRAKGLARAASDIDIAVEGLPTDLQVEALRDLLNNDLPLPYAIDVQAMERIENSALREHMERRGILIFEAKSRSIY